MFLSGRQPFLVARMEPVLDFPGNLNELRIQTLLQFGQITADPGLEPIRPGGLDHPPRVSLAGFGDGATLDAIAGVEFSPFVRGGLSV